MYPGPPRTDRRTSTPTRKARSFPHISKRPDQPLEHPHRTDHQAPPQTPRKPLLPQIPTQSWNTRPEATSPLKITAQPQATPGPTTRNSPNSTPGGTRPGEPAGTTATTKPTPTTPPAAPTPTPPASGSAPNNAPSTNSTPTNNTSSPPSASTHPTPLHCDGRRPVGPSSHNPDRLQSKNWGAHLSR